MNLANIEQSADVAESAQVSATARIWHLAQVRENAVIGDKTIIGRGAYIGSDVIVGENCKIQNYALIYEPAILGDGVFIGPAVVLTNDTFPRAVTPNGEQKAASDWTPVGVTIDSGASVGARSVCVAPVKIGKWAMVGAGAIVVNDVPDFALVVGTPARQIGWVGKTGQRLEAVSERHWLCRVTGQKFVESEHGVLREEEVE